MPAYGTLKVGVAYGGAFYAFLPLNDVGLNENSPIDQIRSAASSIASAVKTQVGPTSYRQKNKLMYQTFNHLFETGSNSAPRECGLELPVWSNIH